VKHSLVRRGIIPGSLLFHSNGYLVLDACAEVMLRRMTFSVWELEFNATSIASPKRSISAIHFRRQIYVGVETFSSVVAENGRIYILRGVVGNQVISMHDIASGARSKPSHAAT
jgi:hypothetical protein